MSDPKPSATHYPRPASVDAACEVIDILRAELAAVCVAAGRSKDGTGYDVDWFHLHKDVAARVSETVTPKDALACLDCGTSWTDPAIMCPKCGEAGIRSQQRQEMHVVQADVTLFARSLRAQGTPWSEGCARVLEQLWRDVSASRSATRSPERGVEIPPVSIHGPYLGAKPWEQHPLRTLHACVETLASAFKGFLPWADELCGQTVRGHEMLIEDTVKRADACMTILEHGEARRSAKLSPNRDELRYAVMRRWMVDENYLIKGMPQAHTREDVDALCDAEIEAARKRGELYVDGGRK